MKKTIMGLATIILVLSSCSKNEITENGGDVAGNDPSIIDFSIYTGSRAVDSKLSLLELDANGIKVFALQNKGGTDVEKRFSAFYKYDAQTVSWAWPTATPDVYKWPTAEGTADAGGFPITFVSLFPYTADLDNTTPDVSIAIEALAKDQTDYICANSGALSEKPKTGNVTLAFEHILSKIQFNVTAGKNNTVNVQSIKVINVQNHTSMAANTKPTYNPFKNEWTNAITSPNEVETYVMYSYRNYAAANDGTGYTAAQAIIGGTNGLTAAVAGNSGALMLMPQYATTAWNDAAFRVAAKLVVDNNNTNTVTEAALMANWTGSESPAGLKDNAAWQGARIEVIYNVTDGTNYLVGAANRFVRVGYSLKLLQATPWKQGKMYTYIISLGSDNVSGGMLLDPFYYNETGTATEGPIYPTGIIPGDPINNNTGVIGFKLSVGEWGVSEDKPIQ